MIDGFVSNKVCIKEREKEKRQQNKKKKYKTALLRKYDLRKESKWPCAEEARGQVDEPGPASTNCLNGSRSP